MSQSSTDAKQNLIINGQDEQTADFNEDSSTLGQGTESLGLVEIRTRAGTWRTSGILG